MNCQKYLFFKILICSLLWINFGSAENKVAPSKTVKQKMGQAANWIKTHKKTSAVLALLYTIGFLGECCDGKNPIEAVILAPLNLTYWLQEVFIKLNIKNEYVDKFYWWREQFEDEICNYI